MDSCYTVRIDKYRQAEVDLSVLEPGTMLVNRVIVPYPSRGVGFGRKVMALCLADADRESVTLVLEINPYGEMSFDQLEAWYNRLGFKWDEDKLYMRRAPKIPNDK